MAKYFGTAYLDNNLIYGNGIYMDYRQKEIDRTGRLISELF